MQELFKKNNVIGNVVGFTPSHIHGRGEEIQQWINGHNFEGSFVIIDDDDFDLQQFQNHIIRTDISLGLQQHHIQQAVDIMNS